ncbi:hypothetical protein AVEN_130445-1, partial [Araneus ventricosus]
KRSSEQEECIRIVKTAASIILEDIRPQVYDTQEHPPPENSLQEIESIIPESLHVLTEETTLNKKRGDLEKWRKRCTAMAHCIISAARPKSFMSGMQVGLAAFLFKKYGSRKLIDVLSPRGFRSSYTGDVRF